jgi:hypothetical protein
VTAAANGAASTAVRVGEVVRLSGTATAPPGAGTIVAAEWDFAGTGTWPHRHAEIRGDRSEETIAVETAYKEPGTYFAALRATAHRDGTVDARACNVANLARVRIEVTP